MQDVAATVEAGERFCVREFVQQNLQTKEDCYEVFAAFCEPNY
jgi:hypothetical protein